MNLTTMNRLGVRMFAAFLLLFSFVPAFAQDRAGRKPANGNMSQVAAASGAADVVGLYQEFEVSLVATNIGNINRYTDVWVKGVFRGPSRTIEIEGFWDGGDVWKVRMVPTEVGQWNYQVTSSVPSLQTSGSFECIPSFATGFVRINPQNPHTFMNDDGTPWLWRGDTSWRGFTDLVAYEDRWKPYIDLRASQGYTAVQSIVVSYIGGMNFWKNEGGLCFAEYNDRKDYDRLNPDYFRWIDKRIDYANSKGIVSIILFTWAQEFVKFSRQQFERFERYLIARYAAKNVMWVICGEYDEAKTDFGIPASEFAYHGRIVRQYDPYDHPISLHPTGRSTSAEFASEDWFDFIMQQTPYYVRDIQRDRQYNKPVVNAEPRYFYVDEDNRESRYGLWEIAVGGGYYTAGFSSTFAPDKGGWDLEALPDEQRWTELLNHTMQSTRWWQMQPRPEWISNGQLLANPGKEYLAYSRGGGPTTIDLSAVSGTLPVEWINPRSGAREKQTTVQGQAAVTFTPPFNGDWVLHIGQGVKRDSIPPNAPLALTAHDITMHSIALSWQPPGAASDGDIANAYMIYRNDVLIATLASTVFVDQGLEEGASYDYRLFALDDEGNKSAASAQLTVRTLRDDQPPQPLTAVLNTENELVVTFSEKVERISAETISNYTISPAVQITAARLSNDQLKVKLVTASHTPGQTYTISIENIRDLAGTPNVMPQAKSLTYELTDRLIISELSPSTYRLDTLTVNDRYYLDRDFTLLQIPEICTGFTWIMTENDDKNETDAHWLSFRTNLSVTILVAYDMSAPALPGWLKSWQDTGRHIGTTDDSPLQLYRKNFPAGQVVLGANEGTQSSSMYIVLVKATEGAASDATPPSVPQGFRFSSL